MNSEMSLCIYDIDHKYALLIENASEIMKQVFKQLQRKPRQKSESSTGFKPMTTGITEGFESH